MRYFTLFFFIIYFTLFVVSYRNFPWTQHNYRYRMKMTTTSTSVINSYITLQSDSTSSTHNTINTIKYIPKLVKTIKLPVWPVIGGILIQLADFLPDKYIAEKIWNSIGGRVVPISLSEENVSPFLLLAHHTHSFTPFDPFRVITNFILPEGFPSHPHAGFDTITYCLEGGFLHRDSEGCKMRYGNGDVQWMRAGRGILHEEMWDLLDSNDNDHQLHHFQSTQHKHIEIFQLWINLPKKSKSNQPIIKILPKQDIKTISIGKFITCKVISGNIKTINNNDDDNVMFISGPGNEIASTMVTILHATLHKPKSKLSILMDGMEKSVVVYVRRGSIFIKKEEENISSKEKIVSIGDYIIYRKPKPSISLNTNKMDLEIIKDEIEIMAGDRGLDCLILIGDPIKEPVVTRGPFVQTSIEDLQEKFKIFSNPNINLYWDYRLSDEDWLKHCSQIRLQSRIDEAT